MKTLCIKLMLNWDVVSQIYNDKKLSAECLFVFVIIVDDFFFI